MTLFDTENRLRDLSSDLKIENIPLDMFAYSNEEGKPLEDVALTKTNTKMILRMKKENLSENQKFISKPTNTTLYASGDGMVLMNKMNEVKTPLLFVSKLSVA